MKRIFIMMTLIGASIFSSSYAAPANTSPVVMQAFQSSFYNAKEIQWEQVGVLSKATFVLDGQYRSVFYNSDGELMAVTQNLSTSQLPKALQASLKKELQGRWISNVFVVTIEGETTYYASLENRDTTMVLISAGTKKWAVYQKSEK